jgi:hypothetical protein
MEQDRRDRARKQEGAAVDATQRADRRYRNNRVELDPAAEAARAREPVRAGAKAPEKAEPTDLDQSTIEPINRPPSICLACLKGYSISSYTSI